MRLAPLNKFVECLLHSTLCPGKKRNKNGIWLGMAKNSRLIQHFCLILAGLINSYQKTWGKISTSKFLERLMR